MSKDGGPVFPSRHLYGHCFGMSLRDWLASVALLGILAGREREVATFSDCAKDAKDAYGYADAMLKEREK